MVQGTVEYRKGFLCPLRRNSYERLKRPTMGTDLDSTIEAKTGCQGYSNLWVR